MHSQECHNCFPCWDEPAFFDHELYPVKGIMKEARRIGFAGNCVSYASVVLDNDTNVYLGLKEGEVRYSYS